MKGSQSRTREQRAHADLPNFIFPAFFTPYMSSLYLWPVALGAFAGEIYCVRRLLPELSTRGVTLAMIAANVASSIVGVVVTMFLLPDGYDRVSVHLDYTPAGRAYVYLSWPVAYVLSVLIETAVMLCIFRQASRTRILRAVSIGNLVSYAVLGTAALFFFDP